jgi:hypothetical protein
MSHSKRSVTQRGAVLVAHTLCCLVALNIAYIGHFEATYEFRTVSLIAVLALYLCLTLASRSVQLKAFKPLVLNCLYFLILLISTLVNKADTVAFLRGCGDGVALMVFVNYFFITRQTDVFFDVMNCVAYIAAGANLLTVLLFPQGLYKVPTDSNLFFLFGHKNLAGALSFLLTCFVILRRFRKGKESLVIPFLLWCINMFVAIKINSSTTIVGLAVFALFFFLFPVRLFKKVYTTMLVSSVVISIILTSATVVLTQIPAVANFIQNVLHKNLTFTGRTFIWSRAYQALARAGSYFLGMGYQTGEVTKLSLYAVHAHNGWLTFAYRGGLLLVAAVFISSWISISKLQRSDIIDGKVSKVIGAVFIYFMVWFLTDTQDGSSILYMFFIFNYFALNIDKVNGTMTFDSMYRRH